MVCGVMGFCLCTCVIYVFLRDGLCDMYMMTGGSPGMYDSIYVCMHVCLFSMFPLYIIIIIILQGYNFGAMTNHLLQGIVSLKVPKHNEELNQVRETYLVAAVCV